MQVRPFSRYLYFKVTYWLTLAKLSFLKCDKKGIIAFVLLFVRLFWAIQKFNQRNQEKPGLEGSSTPRTRMPQLCQGLRITKVGSFVRDCGKLVVLGSFSHWNGGAVLILWNANSTVTNHAIIHHIRIYTLIYINILIVMIFCNWCSATKGALRGSIPRLGVICNDSIWIQLQHKQFIGSVYITLTINLSSPRIND